MKPLAEVDLNDRASYYGGYKAPRVLQWHRISRGTSDRAGQIEHMSFGARFSDTDRYFRGRLGVEATRYLTNKPLVERMIDDEERRREGLPRIVANGYVSDYSPEPDLQFDLTGSDWLKKKFTRKRKAQQSWQPLITAADFPSCPEQILNTPCPIILGHLSDANLATTDIGTSLPFDETIPSIRSAMAHDIEGAGNLNGWISFIVTAVVSGSEGPPSNIARTYSFNRAQKGFWNNVSVATSYRGYFHDGEFWESWLPHQGITGQGRAPTFVRMLTHNTTPGSGDWHTNPTLRDFGLVLTSASDGTDVLSGVNTSTVDQGHGRVKPIYVGIENIGSPPEPHHVGIVSRCAMKEIVSLYLDGIRQEIDTDDTWKVPGHAPWTALFPDPYEDRNGLRYTVIYGKVGFAGPDRMAGVLGDPTIPESGENPYAVGVTLSVLGVEENGDTTGELIASGAQQAKWFVNNFIAPDTPYQSGQYLIAADTQFPHIAGLTLVEESTFDVVDEATSERLGGSPSAVYEGGGIIGANGEFLSAIEVLARFAVSYDFDWIWNRKGQLGISIEPIVPVVGVTAIDDVISIVDRSFRIEDQVSSDFFNIHPFVHTRDYADQTDTGWWVKDEVRDTASITNYDQEREAPEWQLHFGRNETSAGAATIADVMQRKRARFRHPRRRATLRVPLSGLVRTLGEAVPITHVEGIGAAGWEDHQVRIVRDELDPNDNTVVLDCYDLETVFEGSP